MTGQNEFGNPGSAGTVLLAKTCCLRLILLQRAGGLGGYEKHRCVCSSVPVVSRLRAKPQASDAAEHTAGAVAHHHNEKDWFVPINVAVEGLTAEQASWKNGSGNHSVGQLTNHLLFWNGRELAKLKGEPVPKFSGNNDETFTNFDSKKWNDTVKQLDQVMTELEKLVETVDDKKLQAWASEIAHIGTHNAYHVGQIIFVRKLQGSWNPEKGVK